MATVSTYSSTYEGRLLHPGAEHGWWFTHSGWQRALPDFQVNVSAHAWVFGPYTPPPPQELMVKDIRSHVDASGDGGLSRVLYFTVRNTGPNPVRVYVVSFSIVTR
jgi:hypothetical protein